MSRDSGIIIGRTMFETATALASLNPGAWLDLAEGPGLTCDEADGIADFLAAWRDDDGVERGLQILAAHARATMDEDDRHWSLRNGKVDDEG